MAAATFASRSGLVYRLSFPFRPPEANGERTGRGFFFPIRAAFTLRFFAGFT